LSAAACIIWFTWFAVDAIGRGIEQQRFNSVKEAIGTSETREQARAERGRYASGPGAEKLDKILEHQIVVLAARDAELRAKLSNWIGAAPTRAGALAARARYKAPAPELDRELDERLHALSIRGILEAASLEALERARSIYDGRAHAAELDARAAERTVEIKAAIESRWKIVQADISKEPSFRELELIRLRQDDGSFGSRLEAAILERLFQLTATAIEAAQSERAVHSARAAYIATAHASTLDSIRDKRLAMIDDGQYQLASEAIDAALTERAVESARSLYAGTRHAAELNAARAKRLSGIESGEFLDPSIGWFGESLPRGMKRSSKRSSYVWTTDSGLAIDMVFIPAGAFTMGSDVGVVTERPKHSHAIAYGYFIGKFEITRAQYLTFCKATSRALPPEPPWTAVEDEPVVNVTWQDASDFCEWARLRLPTEAEWEKAARGVNGAQYPWGGGPPPEGVVIGGPHNGFRKPLPATGRTVGVSPFGAHDMIGNVAEWCYEPFVRDVYRKYASGDIGPPESGSTRTLRGGGWESQVGPASARSFMSPDTRSRALGFRVQRSI